MLSRRLSEGVDMASKRDWGGGRLVLKDEKVRPEKYYTVGYDAENNRYVLAVVVCWVAWYNRYYLISEEEFGWYETDIDRLDLLADECYASDCSHERFICSEAERDYNPDFKLTLKSDQ